MSDNVKSLANLREHHDFVEANKGKLIAIDFWAVWCGPCRFISPVFEKLAEEHTDVCFAKVDVDNAPDVAQEYGIRAMPTFVFLKDGQKVHEVVGADQGKLKSAVETFKA